MFLLNSSKSFSDGYGSGYGSSSGSAGGISTGLLIAIAIISLIIAILLFVLVVERKKGFRGKFGNWLREYLNFRSVLISGIIKFLYIFLAAFLTIMSFVVMFQGEGNSVLPMILSGLAMLIFGNILLRVMLELTMALIVVWGNTSDIRSVIVKDKEMPEEKKSAEPKVEKKIEEKPVVEEVVVEQQQVEVQQPAEQPPAEQPPETPPANV